MNQREIVVKYIFLGMVELKINLIINQIKFVTQTIELYSEKEKVIDSNAIEKVIVGRGHALRPLTLGFIAVFVKKNENFKISNKETPSILIILEKSVIPRIMQDLQEGKIRTELSIFKNDEHMSLLKAFAQKDMNQNLLLRNQSDFENIWYLVNDDSKSKSNNKSPTQVVVPHLFLGMLQFKASSNSKSFILFVVNSTVKYLKLLTYSTDLQMQEEIINYNIIKLVNYGEVESSQTLAFISIYLDINKYVNQNKLKYLSVGNEKVLDLTITDSKNNETKYLFTSRYILIILDKAIVEKVIQLFRENGVSIFQITNDTEKLMSNLKAFLMKDLEDPNKPLFTTIKSEFTQINNDNTSNNKRIQENYQYERKVVDLVTDSKEEEVTDHFSHKKKIINLVTDSDEEEEVNSKRVKLTDDSSQKFDVKQIFLGMLEFKLRLICKPQIIFDMKQLDLVIYSDIENEIMEKEIIDFKIIRDINYGDGIPFLEKGLSFISILLGTCNYVGKNRLKHVSVGGNRIIDPNMSDYVNNGNKHPLSSKYILIILENTKIDTAVNIFRNNGFEPKLIATTDEEKINSNLKAFLRKDQLNQEDLTSKNKSELETQSRRALRSSATIAEDPDDYLTYVIFPMTPEAQDVITIHRMDMKRFNRCEYFNDNLIDLKIKHMIMDLKEDKKKKVYAFSCLFYAKLTELEDPKAAHALIARWTKNVNLFDLDYIFIPINLTLHWSLVVICKPEQWIQLKINNNDCNNIDNNDNNEACFIHMDSLDMHPTNSIAKVITNYLSNEWRAKSKVTLNGDTDENLFLKMPRVSPLCPKQENGYDCGVYVIKYVETVLSLFPKTTKSDRSSKLANDFSDNMFSPEDITNERLKYKQILIDLANQWELQKKEELEKEEIEASQAKEKKEDELKSKEAANIQETFINSKVTESNNSEWKCQDEDENLVIYNMFKIQDDAQS